MTQRAVEQSEIIVTKAFMAAEAAGRLVCFVYDPEGRIANPAGIEADLRRIEGGLEVKVIIMPRQQKVQGWPDVSSFQSPVRERSSR